MQGFNIPLRRLCVSALDDSLWLLGVEEESLRAPFGASRPAKSTRGARDHERTVEDPRVESGHVRRGALLVAAFFSRQSQASQRRRI